MDFIPSDHHAVVAIVQEATDLETGIKLEIKRWLDEMRQAIILEWQKRDEKYWQIRKKVIWAVPPDDTIADEPSINPGYLKIVNLLESWIGLNITKNDIDVYLYQCFEFLEHEIELKTALQMNAYILIALEKTGWWVTKVMETEKKEQRKESRSERKKNRKQMIKDENKKRRQKKTQENPRFIATPEYPYPMERLI
jgi:hypothetical protein